MRRGPPPASTQAWLAANEPEPEPPAPTPLSAADVEAIALLGEDVCPAAWQPVTAESFAALAPWKQQRLREALARAPPRPPYRFPHESAEAADISAGSVDWAQPLRGFQLATSGSAPVLLVELGDGRAVVLKFPPVVLPELFGSAVAQRLGVNAPRVRAVSRASAEGRAVLRALLQLAVPEHGDIPLYFDESAGVGAVLLWFRTPFFLLMEFARGRSLDEGPAAPEAVRDPGVQRALGRLMLADIVVNNLDRLPSMVQTRSNVSNIFLGAAQDIVAIDNAASWPAPEHVDEALVAERLARVAAVTAEVRAAPDDEHPEFARVRRLLLSGKPEEEGGWPGLGLDIGAEGTAMVQRGFLEAAADAAASGLDFAGLLAELEAALEREPRAAPQEWGRCLFEELNAVRPCPWLEPHLTVRDTAHHSTMVPDNGAYRAGPRYCAQVVASLGVGLG